MAESDGLGGSSEAAPILVSHWLSWPAVEVPSSIRSRESGAGGEAEMTPGSPLEQDVSQLSPAGPNSSHHDVDRDAEGVRDLVWICPVVALDEVHPTIWANTWRLGIFELRPGDRHLHELQKCIAIDFDCNQPTVMPFGRAAERTGITTTAVAWWTGRRALDGQCDGCLISRLMIGSGFRPNARRGKRAVDFMDRLSRCPTQAANAVL